MEYERAQVSLLRDRLAEPPKTIQAIFGPRQSGKTTIVKQALRATTHRYYYYAVDAPGADETNSPDAPASRPLEYVGERDRSWLVRTWEHARAEAKRRDGCVLVLDEIQHIPDWSRTVKGLWDGDRWNEVPLRVVILGSAPMAIQSSLNESLMGRFELIPVGHWSFTEMADAFGLDLAQFLYFGGYPRTQGLAPDWPPHWSEYEPRWRDYVREAIVKPTIDRDVLAMTRVDKPALLRQVFGLAVAHSGQMLPYHKMLGRLQDAGNATTVARYVDLLSLAGLLTGLEKYSPNLLRVRRSPPKFNALNTALLTATSNYSFQEAQADRSFWGRLVESAAGAHLLNTAGSGPRVHYWRESVDEVDFVLEWGTRVVGIEVKSGANAWPTRGMQVFRERFSPHRVVLVTADATTPNAVPLAEFLSRPASDWFEDGE
jgi:hypothetical protein